MTSSAAQIKHNPWLLDKHKLSEELEQAKTKLEDTLKVCQTPLAWLVLSRKIIHIGAQLGETPKKHMHILLNELTALHQGTLLQLRDEIIILGYVVEAGNVAKLWHIPLPPIPIHIQREKNPFQPALFVQYQHGKHWQQMPIFSIQSKLKLSPTAKVGRILLSAIAHGGLLHHGSMESVLLSLDKPMHLAHHMLYINLALRWSGQDAQEIRRWFPDALTQVLLLQHQPLQPQDTRSKPWFYIKDFLQACGLQNHAMPKNMTAILDAIAFGFKLKIPFFLVDYATRGFVSHSLKEHAWLRMQGLAYQQEQPAAPDTEEAPLHLPELHANDAPDDAWARQIKDCLKAGSKSQALKAAEQLARLHAPTSVIETYILAWMEYMLRYGSKIGRPLALSTIKGYVTRVIRGLPSLTFDLKRDEFTAEVWEEAYIQLLEDAESVDLRKHLAKALREFHFFLLKKQHVEKIESSVLGLGNQLSPVDANIISIDEFHSTLTYIENAKLEFRHQDLPSIIKIITMIGFRCGLRRSEVLKLRIIDIHLGDEPNILIRPHALRRLKTKNAIRRILLKPLLEANELGLLVLWTEKRKAAEMAKAYSPFIFSIPDKDMPIVPDELVFPVIHQAMREVTGDQSLRFHHLRHACASWNILRFMVADYGLPEHIFDHFPKTKQWLEQSSKPLREAWYAHHQPTRKHLYAITSLLGHSSPSMSLEHYIHWCDIMMKHALQKANKPIDIHIWITLTGLPQATVYNQYSQGGEALFLRKICTKFEHRLDTIATAPPPLPHDTAQASAFANITRAWETLYLYSAQQLSLEQLAQKYEASISSLERIVEQATQVANLKAAGRHANYRHTMMTLEHSETRLLCPRMPVDHAAIALAKDYAEKLADVSQQHPQDYTWLLDYFVHHAWNQSTDLIFRQAADAKRYLAMLAKMQVAQKHIIITWYHGKDIPQMSNVQRRKHWKTSLDMAKNRKIQTKKLNNTRKLGDYGWLGIRLLDYLSDKHQDGKSTYAFRFVLLMRAMIDGVERSE